MCARPGCPTLQWYQAQDPSNFTGQGLHLSIRAAITKNYICSAAERLNETRYYLAHCLTQSKYSFDFSGI